MGYFYIHFFELKFGHIECVLPKWQFRVEFSILLSEMFWGKLKRPLTHPQKIYRQHNHIKKIFEVLKTEKFFKVSYLICLWRRAIFKVRSWTFFRVVWQKASSKKLSCTTFVGYNIKISYPVWLQQWFEDENSESYVSWNLRKNWTLLLFFGCFQEFAFFWKKKNKFV